MAVTKSHFCIAPAAFNVDLMACTASVLRSSLSEEALPFFSQYDCAGSAGTDVVAQDVSVVPDTGVPASGFCSPPLIMAGRLAQYVAEYKAPGVALLPDVQAYWFTLLQLATDRSIELAPAAANGCFRWPSTDSGLTNWWYSR